MENCVEQLAETKVMAALKSIIRTYHANHPHDNRPETLSVSYQSEALKYKFDRSTENILDVLVNNRATLIDIIVYHYDTLWRLFTEGNYYFLHSLLQDNILDIRILNEYPEIPGALFGNINKGMMCSSHGVICREKSGNSMLYYLCDILPTLHKLQGYECPSQRRLQKVLWALEAVLFKLSSKVLTKREVKDRIKFLEILYDFIPEPYITSAEVSNAANYLEAKYESQYDAKRIRKYFEKYFPKLPYQPRCLQHLCRCTIQQSLRDSGKYSHETAGLPLPRFLQKYVAARKF